ncbi:MAG: ferritin-like domain-containing protein [Steroidobacteraceae bacterium]
MFGHRLLLDNFQNRIQLGHERRQFLRKTGGLAVGMAGAMMLGADGKAYAQAESGPTEMGGALTDEEILNFALNLEYLEAQFYQYAANGVGLPQSMLTGTGTQGAIAGGMPACLTDPVVRAYAKEIAKDEMEHVSFLRSALGSAAIAMPAIDISGTDPNGAFSAAARAAGLVANGVAFNPYASDDDFLLGAFIFEDVGVTAYAGASPLVSNKTYLQAAADILAVEAYHAGLIRTTLYARGTAMPDLRIDADAISHARDTLNGSIGNDQGISTSTSGVANIVPANSNGMVYNRTPGQVLNIVYLTPNAASQGGFFPKGVNGTLVMSA